LAQSRLRGRNERVRTVAEVVAVEQADPGQVENSAFDPVAFAEVLGGAGQLSDQFGDGGLDGVQVDYDDQDRLLDDLVLASWDRSRWREGGGGKSVRHSTSDPPPLWVVSWT
jgi:hypothetical protein